MGTLLCGKAGSDPAQMHQLALRGQHSPIVLPSMRRLQEHAERVAGWCRELDSSLPPRIAHADGSTSAAAGAAAPGAGNRYSLEKVLRVQADGARLCMAGLR